MKIYCVKCEKEVSFHPNKLVINKDELILFGECESCKSEINRVFIFEL